MTSYCTADELQSWIGGGTSGEEQAHLQLAVDAASRRIDNICSRSFSQDADVSPRRYFAQDIWTVEVDDFATTTGLIVAVDFFGSNSYTTVITAPNYQVEPVSGIVNGTEGWPYNKIRLPFTNTGFGSWFPTYEWQGVQITAKWGWPTVPTPVQQACLLLAAGLWKRKDAPFGVAGFGDYGAVRIREDPDALALLGPYRRFAVGIA